jgi:hypothetical protein
MYDGMLGCAIDIVVDEGEANGLHCWQQKESRKMTLLLSGRGKMGVFKLLPRERECGEFG